MNQFEDQDPDVVMPDEQEEDQHIPVWRYRIFAILLLLVFLVPLLLSVLQIAMHWLTPQVQPTPLLPENLLHG